VYERIFPQAVRKGLSTGSVHVYILTPDGEPIDSLHVVEASKLDRLLQLLQSVVERLKTAEGSPVAQPRPQSVPPVAASDSLILHLTARGFNTNASWREFPSENWIVLAREEWSKLLKPADYTVGESWDVDSDVAARILTYFYPQTENNDISTNKILKQTLQATVISAAAGVATVRLDGDLRMMHSFYADRGNTGFVDASVVGFMDVDSANPRVLKFRMVTLTATYSGERFGVAVRSLQ